MSSHDEQARWRRQVRQHEEDEMVRLYPQGRYLFYEGNDVEGFIKRMSELGLTVNVNVTLTVPPELLKTVQDEFPMGS
jgi:hypothetical protein